MNGMQATDWLRQNLKIGVEAAGLILIRYGLLIRDNDRNSYIKCHTRPEGITEEDLINVFEQEKSNWIR